jgi:alginate O-acetyltransferase complex protein AlgI
MQSPLPVARHPVTNGEFGVCVARRGKTDLLKQTCWMPLVILVTFALVIQSNLSPWQFMWANLFAIFAGCKWLTWSRAADRALESGLWRSIVYLIAWPGMDERMFFDRSTVAIRPNVRGWIEAAFKVIVGVNLFWGVARFIPTNYPMLTGWIGMIGFAFLIHFGLFHLLALLWQSCGIDVQFVFRSPALARSVSNLWGSRWNLAFRDLSHSLVYQPLVARLGVAGASLAVFTASGLVHELVISVPAGAGYGLPTAYFLFQWLGVIVERSTLGRRFGLRRGFAGWLFALVVVAGPACLLFHPPFVTGVMIPFMRAIGSI